MIRWQLLQIADSAFPTGGFAHSSGLEAAVHHGWANTVERLDEYVREHLWNVGRGSLPFVGAAYDAPRDVWALDVRTDATLTSHVANRASRTQGRTFVAACAQTFEKRDVMALAARARTREVSAHVAPMFGASLCALGVARTDALALYLYFALRGVTSAAIRLGVVGPHEAQRLQRRQEGTLDAVLAECATVDLAEVAVVAPLHDVLGATHDRLYVRLFQS